MKKKRNIFLAAVLLLAMATPSRAQIFVMDEDMNFRPAVDEEAVLSNPPLAQGYDYYLPIGDGLLLLTALGGAYLLKKKNTNK